MTSRKRKMMIGAGWLALAIVIVAAVYIVLAFLQGARAGMVFSMMQVTRHKVEELAETAEDDIGTRYFPEVLPASNQDTCRCPTCGLPLTYAPTFEDERLTINGKPNRIVLWSECNHLDGQRFIMRQDLQVERVGDFDIDWKERTVKPGALKR